MNHKILFILSILCVLAHKQRVFSFSAKSQTTRRRFFDTVLPQTCVVSYALTANTKSACSVPLVGRFEPLKGANSFIGSWKYEGTKGIPQGELVFLKNGEVELRSIATSSNGDDDYSSRVLAVGAVPWKYISPKGANTMVTVSFTLDEDGQDDVLIFEGVVDSAGGPERTLEGIIATGRAEIGARGSGPMKQVGSFKAAFLQ